jgi:mitotic spindle assembly checkpoint protein MAD2
MVKKYGLTLFTSADEALESYIQQVMKKSQGEHTIGGFVLTNSAVSRTPLSSLLPCVAVMLLNNQLSSLALVIITRDTKETVERWQFDIQTEDPLPTPGSDDAAAPA